MIIVKEIIIIISMYYNYRDHVPQPLPDGTVREYPFHKDCHCCTPVYEGDNNRPLIKDVTLHCKNESTVIVPVITKIPSRCQCTTCEHNIWVVIEFYYNITP